MQWSSACSGSDAPRWAFAALTDLHRSTMLSGRTSHSDARVLPLPPRFIQLIAAELDPRKRAFLRESPALFDPAEDVPVQLFRCMFDICRPEARNCAHAEAESPHASFRKWAERPLLKRSLVWFIGFSCKTASGLACSGRPTAGLLFSCSPCTHACLVIFVSTRVPVVALDRSLMHTAVTSATVLRSVHLRPHRHIRSDFLRSVVYTSG